MENLINKIYVSAREVVGKAVYEVRYLTGVGWNYDLWETHRDLRARRDQRRREDPEFRKCYLDYSD